MSSTRTRTKDEDSRPHKNTGPLITGNPSFIQKSKSFLTQTHVVKDKPTNDSMYQMQDINKISVEVSFNQKKEVHNKPKVSNLKKQTQPENCIKASAENNNPSWVVIK